VDVEVPAGLRYVSDRRPGITRKKRGRSFAYYYPDGKQVGDPNELSRIKSLAIPPAYRDVWISPAANGHLQATGRDARGRKQYRYHKRWREVRDEAKFQRLAAFARKLPTIRAKVKADLALEGVPRRKVLATIVRLLDTTGIRVGNEEYVKANGSFGLTTFRSEHVRVRRSGIRFRFRGKSGKEHSITLDDARLARIIRRCRDLPGEDLFEYVDEEGQVAQIDSDAVNAYIREIAGEEFSAKDFRTWIGTVSCMNALVEPAENARDAKAKVAAALQCVAAKLGNTPAVCRKAYVHPAVLETYARDLKVPKAGDERLVLRFLEAVERKEKMPLEKLLKKSVTYSGGKARAL
jgi:DNA topoisomerase I